ncbi:hypothetical protein WOLCODRAFT_149928 [Wolfiporia cocos MD-104 SS10]|uniref:Uncharacterized protein n=1 Tax=Wolfiporia cocos (strain MD-104) TaxID=742152 RepID=A0A2H3JQ58_WOLCO|nr:hypothetical protein WOLCODRAFT_149928 [Wolfiporia cocos MD-104 SS10]
MEERIGDYFHQVVGLQHQAWEHIAKRKDLKKPTHDDDDDDDFDNKDSDSAPVNKRMPNLPPLENLAPRPSPRTRSGYVGQEFPAYNGEFDILRMREIRNVPPKWKIPQVSDKRRETFTPIPTARDLPTYSQSRR